VSQQDVDAIAARVAELVSKARSYAKTDPEVALGQARKAAEAIARTVYAREVGEPGKMLLNELLQKLAAQKAVPQSIQIPFGTIQVYGNFGSHAQSDMRTIDADYVAPAISALNAVTAWFFDEYLTHPMPALATPPAAPALEAPPPRKRRLWPFAVAGVVVVAGAGGALMMMGKREPPPPPPPVNRDEPVVPAVAPVAPVARTIEPSVETASKNDLELSYRVLVRSPNDKEPRAIHSGDTVKTGDEMIFYVQPSQPAHCFVLQRNGKTKALDVLFPNKLLELKNPLPAESTRLPPEPHTLTLDNKALGTETVYLIASKHPLPDLAASLDGDKPRAIADQVVTIAMAKRSDCAGTARDLVLDATGPCAVQPRGLVLDAPKAAPAGTRGIRAQGDDDIVLVPFQFVHEAK
jgi:hypothetical protein